MNLFMNITTEIKIFLKMRNLFFLSSVISDLEKSLNMFLWANSFVMKMKSEASRLY